MILFGHFNALYGSHSQSKNGLFFSISCILVLIFPFFIIYFPKCEGKGNFPKSQIKSLNVIVGPDLGLNCLPNLDPNCYWLTLAERVSSFLRHSINCVLTLYSLNGFFLLIRCINFGTVHYIYRGSQLIISK